MKPIIHICVAVLITGCADQGYVRRWNDMWVDIALRHRFEKYSCAHALEGYSKDPPPAFSHRKRATPAREQVLVKTPGADPEARKQIAQRTQDSIRALSAKIDVLEDALTGRATAASQGGVRKMTVLFLPAFFCAGIKEQEIRDAPGCGGA